MLVVSFCRCVEWTSSFRGTYRQFWITGILVMIIMWFVLADFLRRSLLFMVVIAFSVVRLQDKQRVKWEIVEEEQQLEHMVYSCISIVIIHLSSFSKLQLEIDSNMCEISPQSRHSTFKNAFLNHTLHHL